MPHRRRQNLHLRRHSPRLAEGGRRHVEAGHPEGRHRHDSPPQLPGVRLHLHGGLHARRRRHHRQPLLHRRRTRQATGRLQRQARRHALRPRPQAQQPASAAPLLQGGNRRRPTGELLGFPGGRRERGSGG